MTSGRSSALSTVRHALHRAAAGVARAVEVLAGTILVTMVFLLVYSAIQNAAGWRGQVLWLEEVAQLGLIQLAMLGAALALRAGAHQGVDALTRLFPPRLRRIVAVLDWVLIAAFGIYFAACGVAYVQATAVDGGRLDALALPRWPFYLCYPLAGVLFTVFAAEKLLAPGQDDPVGSAGDEPDGPAEPAGSTPSEEGDP